jgi:thiosulfate reductase cytochrome b subunit
LAKNRDDDNFDSKVNLDPEDTLVVTRHAAAIKTSSHPDSTTSTTIWEVTHQQPLVGWTWMFGLIGAGPSTHDSLVVLRADTDALVFSCDHTDLDSVRNRHFVVLFLFCCFFISYVFFVAGGGQFDHSLRITACDWIRALREERQDIISFLQRFFIHFNR